MSFYYMSRRQMVTIVHLGTQLGPCPQRMPCQEGPQCSQHVAGAAEAAEQFTKLAREQALLMCIWHQLSPWLSPGQCIFPDLSGRTWSSWQERAAAFSKAFCAIRRADEKEKKEKLQFSCSEIVQKAGLSSEYGISRDLRRNHRNFQH